MKKLFLSLGGGLAVLVFSVSFAFAAKPVDTCHSVLDGNIPYTASHYLYGDNMSTGYDAFGYNYQAHIFNGTFGNAYFGRSDMAPYAGDDSAYLAEYPSADSHWAWPFRNVNLQMKWNDAWLSNRDCGTQDQSAQAEYSDDSTPDNYLDRHYPTTSYIGSGAWLTNHATGSYTSSEKYHWDIDGNWLLDFAGGTDNREFRNLVQDAEGNVTGEFWWLSSGGWLYGGTLVGTISGDTLNLHYVRPFPYTYTGDFAGTIGNNAITGGTFQDNNGNNLQWTATGTSEKVYDTCTVSDFVKIIAPPADAYKDADIWYTADGAEIGPAVWGSFAIIQEIASDPCGEYGVIDYMSPLRKGLGHW